MKYLLTILSFLLAVSQANRDYPFKKVLILGERDGTYLE
jgi:hypothetical protein